MLAFSRMHYLLKALLVSLLLLSVTPAVADDIGRNAQLLRTAEDFRVRTQAALALGASKDGRAVVPLCQGLADDNRTVRIASATALARLRKGGGACLERRLKTEQDARVKSAIQRALGNLGGGEPAIGPGTKYFVAIQKLAGPDRLNDPVRAAFVKGARGRKDVGFAPAGQSPDEAAQLLDKFASARGFLLAPKVGRPKYEGGILRVKMSVAIMSYPGSALIGSFSKTVGMSGISEPDTDAENELVETAAEESMKQFLQVAASLHP